MKNKQQWRKGMGLAQIMATLLVVLPTMAFIVTFLLDYWSVMQADYRLKLIANMGAEYANSREDTSNFNDSNTTTDLINAVNTSNLCPNGTSLSLSSFANNEPTDQISVVVNYVHNGPYLKNKTASTNMRTYSYHDQNLSVILVCQ